MLEPTDTATTISILLVLVVELAGVTRDDSEDPAKVLFDNPFMLPLGSVHPRLSDLWPKLGRLNVVHAINSVTLGAAFALVLTTDRSVTRTVLGFVVLTLWLALPLLEVDAYEAIAKADVQPRSLVYHAVLVCITIAIAVFSPYEVFGLLSIPTAKGFFSFGWANRLDPTQIGGAAALTVLFALSVYVFLSRLASEVQIVTQNSSGNTERL